MKHFPYILGILIGVVIVTMLNTFENRRDLQTIHPTIECPSVGDRDYEHYMGKMDYFLSLQDAMNKYECYLSDSVLLEAERFYVIQSNKEKYKPYWNH